MNLRKSVYAARLSAVMLGFIINRCAWWFCGAPLAMRPKWVACADQAAKSSKILDAEISRQSSGVWTGYPPEFGLLDIAALLLS